MKSYKETTERIFEKSSRLINVRKKRKKAAAGVCAAVFSGALLLTYAGLSSGNSADEPENFPETFSTYRKTDAEFSLEEGYGLLELYESEEISEMVFNELSEPFEGIHTEICPDGDDTIIEKPEEYLEDYGVDIYTAVLPEGFRKERVTADGSLNQLSIYYLNQNAAFVKVAVSKIRDYFQAASASLPAGTEIKPSVINGSELFVFRYEDAGGTSYTAFFSKGDAKFIIEGRRVTENEFITILKGYF